MNSMRKALVDLRTQSEEVSRGEKSVRFDAVRLDAAMHAMDDRRDGTGENVSRTQTENSTDDQFQ